LREFFLKERIKMDVSAMGIGRLGRLSRIEFARRGSALNYVHLGQPHAIGQLSFRELQRLSGKILPLP
jgi:3-dehydroquinate dehydratase